jgi:hypothetical protein
MKLCLLLLLAAALPLSAQEPQPEPQPEPQAETQPAEVPAGESLASVNEEPAENPKVKLGHPLDPADVATLTGRDVRRALDWGVENSCTNIAGHCPPYALARTTVYFAPPDTYGNRWLDDAPGAPALFGHGRRDALFLVGPGARPRIFFPVFNGMFFVTPR